MTSTNTLSRTLHDVGLAAWFGGSLFGASALNPASNEVDPKDSLRVADSAWGRWTPVNALAIGAHLLGSVAVTWGNKGRLAGQQGVASTAALKAGLTAAALGATAYSRVLGQRVMEYETSAASYAFGEPATEDAVTPAPQTPEDVAAAQRRLRMLQWAIPALTGAMMAVTAVMGEQQRPSRVAGGFLQRLVS
jgi:hypothetical protein